MAAADSLPKSLVIDYPKLKRSGRYKRTNNVRHIPDFDLVWLASRVRNTVPSAGTRSNNDVASLEDTADCERPDDLGPGT